MKEIKVYRLYSGLGDMIGDVKKDSIVPVVTFASSENDTKIRNIMGMVNEKCQLAVP